MRCCGLLLLVLAASACSDFKGSAAPPSTSGDGGSVADADVGRDGGAPEGGANVTVETLISGRSRPGARSAAAFRPWRGGLAVRGDAVHWVESGAQPGLYTMPIAGCPGGTCVQKRATFTRPSVFTANATMMYVADVTALRAYPFAGGAPSPVATGSAELVNAATDGASVFFTAGGDSAIWRANGGTTQAIIYSNGTPFAMAVAGSTVYWVGVDISGQNGAIQSIGTDGKNAREVSRFSNGFDAMGGSPQYLYYARDGNPGTVHRVTMASGRDEVVDRDAREVTDFAVDDAYAYWVEGGDAPDYLSGRLRRAPHDGPAETLAASIPYPVAVAASGKTVIVASAGTQANSFADGALLRVTVGP